MWSLGLANLTNYDKGHDSPALVIHIVVVTVVA